MFDFELKLATGRIVTICADSGPDAITIYRQSYPAARIVAWRTISHGHLTGKIHHVVNPAI